MIQRRRRLTSPKLFHQIARQGAWHRGRLVSVRSVAARGVGQYTVIIGKKVAKLATDRNRSKRRVRGAVETLARQDPYRRALERHHLLFVIHRSLSDVSAAAIARELEAALGRLATSANAP